MPARNTAPDRLRKIREDQMKSQEQVAAEAGVALSTYQRAEAGESVSLRTVRKIARALGVEPEELLEAYEGTLQGSGAPAHRRKRLANAAALRASGGETKRRVLELARVYGLHRAAAPGTSEHALFSERSGEAFEVLGSAALRSREITAAYEFLLGAGPSELGALLGDERGAPDPGRVRLFADTLFELAERGEIDLPTAIARVGLIRMAFAL